MTSRQAGGIGLIAVGLIAGAGPLAVVIWAREMYTTGVATRGWLTLGASLAIGPVCLFLGSRLLRERLPAS